jgi:hypothetical protein
MGIVARRVPTIVVEPDGLYICSFSESPTNSHSNLETKVLIGFQGDFGTIDPIFSSLILFNQHRVRTLSLAWGKRGLFKKLDGAKQHPRVIRFYCCCAVRGHSRVSKVYSSVSPIYFSQLIKMRVESVSH